MKVQQDAGFEFEIKVAETDFVFETPAVVFNNDIVPQKEEVVRNGS